MIVYFIMFCLSAEDEHSCWSENQLKSMYNFD